MRTTHLPLTAEQQQLAAGCIAWAVKRAVRFADRRGLDRDDCISAATASLLPAAARYDPARAAFTTYATYHINAALYRLAEQEGRRLRPVFLSRMSRGGRRHLFHLAAGRQGPSDQAAALDLFRRIEQLLPPRWWWMVRDRFLLGLDCQEIGDRLGITRERVRQILNQALRHLREVLDAGEGGAA